MTVPDQTIEGSPLTPMVPAHLSIPFITCRETGTETCGTRSVFPPDYLWIGLDNYMYTNCTLAYNLLSKVWLMGCATCNYSYLLMGKGMAYGGLPFPVLVVLYWMLSISTVWATIFPNSSPPWDVSTRGLSFWKTDWTSYWTAFISYLHANLKIISRSVSCFATGSPCDV